MGYAIAEALSNQGAKVILVSGPVSVSTSHKSIQVVPVHSANEMYEACINSFPGCDGAVMTAAVADFTPVNPERQKTKRGKENYLVELKPTKDIAAELGALKKPGQILTGFALETNNELVNARQKLEKKNLDLIVLNSLNDDGAGFGFDTNKVVILGKNNKMLSFELKSKREVAVDIVNEIISLLPV
jgi:phosphopantothenoylcysteine decarboxylase / phosphopantothenate---cysteine ligase